MASTTLDNSSATVFSPTDCADGSEGATKDDFIQWKEFVFIFLNGLGYNEREVHFEPTVSTIEENPLQALISNLEVLWRRRK